VLTCTVWSQCMPVLDKQMDRQINIMATAMSSCHRIHIYIENFKMMKP